MAHHATVDYEVASPPTCAPQQFSPWRRLWCIRGPPRIIEPSPVNHPTWEGPEGGRMKQRLFAAAAVIAVIVGIAVVYSRQSSGQQSAPPVQRQQVNVVRVKPDMIDTWIDFQVQRTIPALKKAGVVQREAYQA